MKQLLKKTRGIELANEEYAFPFESPSGTEQLMECTVIDGEGTIALYELIKGERVQVGDSHFLSRKPGNSFYIALKTPKRASKWEIAFRGTGKFKFEFPDIESDDPLYPKSVRKERLNSKRYNRKGVSKK
jgi:hypothetical protein